MKIALLSFYSGYVPRGVETYVHELANRLAKHDKVIVFQSGPVLKGAKYETNKIDLPIDWNQKDSRGTFRKLVLLDYWSLLIKAFTQASLKSMPQDIDIVITTNGCWQTILCRMWTKKHNKKHILAGQSGPGLDDRINLLCRPDVFIALTEFQKKWAENNGFGVKVEKIPNGVDLNSFRPDMKPVSLNLPKPVFLCVAGLEKGKRIDLTIKAVSKLTKGSLVVMGSGIDKTNLTILGNKLMPGRIEFLQVKHEEIPAYFSASDIFTMVPVPSESFGIVYVEAMASGLPVVATDDPIRREIVGAAGLFVDPVDTQKYAEALQKALATNWGNKPRQQAEKFSWDNIASQYEQLFKSLT